MESCITGNQPAQIYLASTDLSVREISESHKAFQNDKRDCEIAFFRENEAFLKFLLFKNLFSNLKILFLSYILVKKASQARRFMLLVCLFIPRVLTTRCTEDSWGSRIGILSRKIRCKGAKVVQAERIFMNM